MSKNKLIIEMAIFTAFLFVSFSLIIINEKSKDFLAPKVEEKFKKYIDKTYSSKKQEFKYKKTKYNRKLERFEMKIENTTNSNLYFMLYYKNKKITSSYKKDYVEGKTLLSYWQNNIEKKINSKKYPEVKALFSKNLNQYNNDDYRLLLTSKEPNYLPSYELTVTLEVAKLDKVKITQAINDFYIYIKGKNISPKYFNFKVICSSTQDSINIKKLSESDILSSLDEIIRDIILKKSSN